MFCDNALAKRATLTYNTQNLLNPDAWLFYRPHKGAAHPVLTVIFILLWRVTVELMQETGVNPFPIVFLHMHAPTIIVCGNINMAKIEPDQGIIVMGKNEEKPPWLKIEMYKAWVDFPFLTNSGYNLYNTTYVWLETKIK